MPPTSQQRSAAAAALAVPLCLAALATVPGPAVRAGGSPEYTVEDVGFLYNASVSDAPEPGINASGQVTGGSVPVGIFRRRGSARGAALAPLPPPGTRGVASLPNRTRVRIGPRGEVIAEFTAHFTDSGLTQTTDIGTLGGFLSNAYAINDGGLVVGYSLDDEYFARAFRYPAVTGMGVRAKAQDLGNLLDLGDLGGGNSFANAINTAGVVVGSSSLGIEGPYHAFRWTEGGKPAMIDLGTLPKGSNSGAYGINDAGLIVGASEDAVGNPHPVIFAPGAMPPVQDLGTLGGSTGHARDVNNQTPAMIVGESTIPLMGWCAEGAAEGGEKPPAEAERAAPCCPVVVDGATHAFRKPANGGPMQDLGTIPGFVNYYATAVNDSGVIVGSMDDAPVGPFGGLNGVTEHAFVWEDKDQNGPDDGDLRDLNDLIPPDSGWVLQRATGINNAGQITGMGTFDGVRKAFRLTLIDNTPPSMTNCSVMPASRTAAGGDFTLSVDVSDDSGVQEVKALVTKPDMSVEAVTLSNVAKTSTYSGTFSAPANMTAMDQFYPVSFTAKDTVDNENSLTCNGFTVLKNAAPTIPACNVSPNSRGPAGGQFTVTATVADDIGVTSVYASISGPNMIPSAPMSLDSGTALNGTYSGNFTAPGNNTAITQTYYVNVTAQDGFGGELTMFCEAVTVDPNQPPVVTECDVTPDALPAAGGQFTVTATVTDDVGVTSVTALVSGPNAVCPVVMTLQSGSATNGVYQGAFNVPANPTETSQLYDVDVKAQDGLDGCTTVDCETVTVIGAVLDNQPPVISDCAFDPQFLPNTGGEVYVEAVVTDNLAVATVKARIEQPGGDIDEVLLTNKGKSLFSGTVDVDGAALQAGEFLPLEIVAKDAAGNTSTEECGAVRIAGTSEDLPGAVEVTPRVVNFGNVFVGKSSTKSVVIRHVGGSGNSLLVFRHTFPEPPFSLLQAPPQVAGTHPTLSGFVVLGSGLQKHLKVKFAPSEVGCFEGTLVFLTNDPQQPLIEVKLKGNGCKKVRRR
jgi:probable HAF family extracellular repeat protein